MRRALAVCLFLLAVAPAHAQDDVIRLVLGYPAGASIDLLSRLVAERMRASLGRPVIVESRPGAGGRIANEVVKAAPADGTTLLVTPIATMAIFPHSYAGQLRYDPLRDFAAVAHLSNFQLGFGVAAATTARRRRAACRISSA